MKRFFGFLVLVACIMSGCNKDNESPEMTIGNITVSDKNEMNQRLYADRNQSGFEFTAAQSWNATVTETGSKVANATSSPDWIELSRYDGPAGKYRLTIDLETNTTGAVRTAVITIVCGDTRITVTIRQEATTESGDIPDDGEEVNPSYGDTTVVDIPDENFRNFLIENKNCGSLGGKIRQFELDMIEYIDCSGQNIASLEGIDHFRRLLGLNCLGNPITSLDLSGNTVLRELACSGNGSDTGEETKIMSLDLTGCESLEKLTAYSLDVESIVGLSTCKELKILIAESCKIAAGLDLKACKNLESVKLNYNDYPAIDVSGCTLLQTIDCGYSDKTLETLNVTGCSSLKTLVINDSKLRELDLAGCPSLVTLTCEHGALQSLDLSPCKALSELNCNKNELTQLDISCCPEITTVEVPYNRLSEIDARANKNLEKLDVTYNEAGMNIYLLESHKAWPFELKKDHDANVFYE